MVTRNGLPFVLADYPRARISASSLVTASRSSAGAGAFFLVRAGFGVVIAFASGESASNHFSRGVFGACVFAFGAGVWSFAISANIAMNEPSASVTASSFESASHFSESARTDDDAMRRRAFGVPSFVSAESSRLTRDFAVSDERSNIPTTSAI